jgi:hypothetical protein
MKKSVLLFTFFGLFSVNSLVASPIDKKKSITLDQDMSGEHSALRSKKFYSQYCAAVALSGCIGAITGGCVRWLEKQLNFDASPMALFLYLLSWSLESEFRYEVVASLQNDLDAYGVGHRKHLMFRTAQLASWIMYLQEHA